MKIEELAAKYTMAPFKGDKGMRAEVITRDLKAAGLNPFSDSVGNIWVAKGKGEKSVIISSHMDTDYGLNPKDQHFVLKEGVMEGTLDNSAGCAINAWLAMSSSPACTAYFVFTVGEEDNYQGAKAVKWFIEQGKVNNGKHDIKLEPQLFIALDVTFPAASTPSSVAKWDLNALAFAENFSRLDIEQHVSSYLSKSRHRGVAGSRWVRTEDEADIFSSDFNAFAFGPVTEGDMHNGLCRTSVKSLESVADALQSMLTESRFLDALAVPRSVTAKRPELIRDNGFSAPSPSCVHTGEGFAIFEDRHLGFYARIYCDGRMITLAKDTGKSGVRFLVKEKHLKETVVGARLFRQYWESQAGIVPLEQYLNDLAHSWTDDSLIGTLPDRSYRVWKAHGNGMPNYYATPGNSLKPRIPVILRNNAFYASVPSASDSYLIVMSAGISGTWRSARLLGAPDSRGARQITGEVPLILIDGRLYCQLSSIKALALEEHYSRVIQHA